MEGTYLSLLPKELINIICSYLSNLDAYFCTQSTFYTSNKLNLSNDNRIDSTFLKHILKNSQLGNVTELNMTGIHWISTADIRSGIRKCVHLKTLLLFDTKMDLTKANVKLYLELNKMKVLGLTQKKKNYQRMDPAFKQMNLDCFYCHNKYFTYQLWDNFEVCYIVAKKNMSYGSHGQNIYNCNWLQTAMEFSTSKLDMNIFDTRYKETACIKQISEKSFSGPDENLISRFISYRNVIHLLIKPDRTSSDVRLLRLDLLKYIPNLVKLDIHVMVHLGANFLEPIFANCPKLKFLKIKNENAQINMIHLKMAQALEDFSYTTAYPLNLSRLFMEFQENSYTKLRRLFVSYGIGGPKLRLPNLRKFLLNNPQLYCFILINEMTLAEIKEIQEMFDAKIKEPFQYFKVMKELYNKLDFDNLADDIPICNYDLFESIYEIDSVKKRFNFYF
ncbi:PREDICTED: uncharacterized protein LOC108561462 [Nicrophorus vespilloides]|uniref:Uncharacterized protein LOC108561462 n=1 Tax=Nicrophorus vespilloides TaxID=110193 RepID=A0ABM1MJZ2_NICVS|nr:PREDICTED: uncharacterized protein LOC108561462 [Nicrophorus vespilloides]